MSDVNIINIRVLVIEFLYYTIIYVLLAAEVENSTSAFLCHFEY